MDVTGRVLSAPASSTPRPLAGPRGTVPLLLLVLLAAAGPAAQAEEGPPPADAVDAAIDRGVAWLVGEQEPNGGFGGGSRAVGHDALVALTLLHAGARETGDAPADRALRRLLRRLDRTGPGRGSRRADRDAQTYGTSLLLLVLRDRGRDEDRPRRQHLATLLGRMQAENGQWAYEAERGGRRPAVGDNSNSQLAVLALGAAVGEGLEVDPAVLRRAWAWWRSAAQEDGAFGYASGGARRSAGTGSMTAAGIASLAILEATLTGSDALAADAPEASRVRASAEARLADEFRPDRNFGPAPSGVRQRQRRAGRGWLHYFLWSVERAMVLAGRERLGEHDWYAEGARHLLATQGDDGAWRGERPLYATCFALLFLTRAADPPRVFTPPARAAGPVTPSEGSAPEPTPAPEAGPPPGTPADVAGWLADDTLPTAERVVRCRAVGPRGLPPLVRALDDADEQVRQRAHELLHLLLGPERVGGAASHPLARGRLAFWVRRHQDVLVLRDGRFVLP